MAGRAGYKVDGLRVAQARQAIKDAAGKSMTQAELADLAGVHRVTITKIENGDAAVSLDLVERLAEILTRSRGYLLGEPHDPIEEAQIRFDAALARLSDGFGDLGEAVHYLTAHAGDVGRERQPVKS